MRSFFLVILLFGMFMQTVAASMSELVEDLLEEGADQEAALLLALEPETLLSSSTEETLSIRNGGPKDWAQLWMTTKNAQNFRLAGALLFRLYMENPMHAVFTEKPELAELVLQSRNAEREEADSEAAALYAKWKERAGIKEPAKAPSLWRPGELFGFCVVKFYRSCVSPALASRCVLYPSCSQYFLEASRKHGFLGVPMGAARLIHEPDAICEENQFFLPNGRVLYEDSVEEHDFWFSAPTTAQ